MKIVLYVDDNVDELLIFEAACRLGRVAFEVRSVHGSEEGFAYLEGRGRFADRLRFPVPDLLLVDIKMAGADGFDVLARVRSRPDLAGLPVLLLTSSVLPADARRAVERGAQGCLSKPVEIARTIELVQAIDAELATPIGWTERLARFAVR